MPNFEVCKSCKTGCGHSKNTLFCRDLLAAHALKMGGHGGLNILPQKSWHGALRVPIGDVHAAWHASDSHLPMHGCTSQFTTATRGRRSSATRPRRGRRKKLHSKLLRTGSENTGGSCCCRGLAGQRTMANRRQQQQQGRQALLRLPWWRCRRRCSTSTSGRRRKPGRWRSTQRSW